MKYKKKRRLSLLIDSAETLSSSLGEGGGGGGGGSFFGLGQKAVKIDYNEVVDDGRMAEVVRWIVNSYIDEWREYLFSLSLSLSLSLLSLLSFQFFFIDFRIICFKLAGHSLPLRTYSAIYRTFELGAVVLSVFVIEELRIEYRNRRWWTAFVTCYFFFGYPPSYSSNSLCLVCQCGCPLSNSAILLVN